MKGWEISFSHTIPVIAISFEASCSAPGAHGVVPSSRHAQADRHRFRIPLPGPKRQFSPTSQRLWAPRISSGLWATLSTATRSRSKNGPQVHARPREPHQSVLHIGPDPDPPCVELTGLDVWLPQGKNPTTFRSLCGQTVWTHHSASTRYRTWPPRETR
jgi:hypothetical protein